MESMKRGSAPRNDVSATRWDINNSLIIINNSALPPLFISPFLPSHPS